MINLCPECRKGVTTQLEADKFVYGIGKDAVELSVTIPIRHCESCNFTFTDEVADQIKDQAIVHHLHLRRPRKIKTMCKTCGVLFEGFEDSYKHYEETNADHNQFQEVYVPFQQKSDHPILSEKTK